ncbi:MAG: hypothetical protein KF898_07750 [Parachlamydiales bacterium]|nr:hypothetical protein [Candidatus Acheromyda pituitae]
MAHQINFSQEVANQAAELARSLAQLESSMNARVPGQVIDERAQLQQLDQIDRAQGSYETMTALASQITDLGQEALLQFQTNLFSIGDTLQRLQGTRASLMGIVDDIAFGDSYRGLMQTSEEVFRRVSPSFTNHDAATEIETTLKDRVAALAENATPHEIEQLQGFMKDIELVHVRYFSEQFATIKGGFNGDAEHDFRSLLPLMGSLTKFALNRNYVSEKNGTSIAELTGSVHSILQEIITEQKAIEALASSGSDLKGQILSALETNDQNALKALLPQVDSDLRGRLYDKIGEIQSRRMAAGAMGMINRGSDAITNFASVDHCRQAVNDVFPTAAPQESLAETLEELLSAFTMSINPSDVAVSIELPNTEDDEDYDALLAQALRMSEISDVSATPYSRETLEKKIAAAGFFNQMHTLNLENDMGNLQLMASLIEDTDQSSAHAIYALQFWFHLHMEKYVEHDDYGRVAFFGDLPPSKAQANATQEERTEVINRALVKVLLSGIQEAIRANDTDSLRTQLDQLSEIRLNNSLPDYYAHPNLEHRIRGFLYNGHVEAGFQDSARSSWSDFGKAALRNEEGCNVPQALKLAAVAKLDEELRAIWGC